MAIQFFNLDIEPTNRCNADCYFCPRDQTPHQGLMTVEVFDQSLSRAVEYREIARIGFFCRRKQGPRAVDFRRVSAQHQVIVGKGEIALISGLLKKRYEFAVGLRWL